MKNKYRFIVPLTAVLVAVSVTFVHCLNFVGNGTAFALEGAENTETDGSADSVAYPYTHTFSISAYYSPLPGQYHYVTGSYQGDIRLNGRGTNGADGTQVYPGMIAAPKSYQFGTKMYIPGIGMTAVHDRGGAIVEAVKEGEEGEGGVGGPKHDRLDLWMGYGDKGLERALSWGLRTVEVTIYGIDNNIAEDVEIPGYDPDEKINQEYFYIPEYYQDSSFAGNSAPKPDRLFPEDLWYLSEGDEVKSLQEYLKQLGYFNGIVNGYFGDETRMAIYVFQKDKGLVQSIADLGAGHFGPSTRDALEKEILTRKEELSPKVNLGPDTQDPDAVKKLQKALSVLGYDVDVNGSYDSKTSKAVLKFQIDNNVLDNASDYGASYFGPRTLSTLTLKLNDALKNGKIEIPVAHANDEIGLLVRSEQVLAPPMHTDLKLGDVGPEVTRLQQELKNLSLLRIDPTGNYGEVTSHAVFKFQQIYGLVGDENSEYAGVFGSQTRAKLNEIIASKNYYNKKISEKRVKSEKVSAAR
ncbi:MAG: peptidoglycan-binding protein [Candidatus Gracilibacteria bacterium]